MVGILQKLKMGRASQRWNRVNNICPWKWCTESLLLLGPWDSLKAVCCNECVNFGAFTSVSICKLTDNPINERETVNHFQASYCYSFADSRSYLSAWQAFFSTNDPYSHYLASFFIPCSVLFLLIFLFQLCLSVRMIWKLNSQVFTIYFSFRVRGLAWSCRVSSGYGYKVIAGAKSVINKYLSDVYITMDHCKVSLPVC